jgi:hypothetical protein
MREEAKVKALREAIALLEANGYAVAQITFPLWKLNAFRLTPRFVAFSVDKRISRREFSVNWIKPNEFCAAIGIERHVLTKKLKLRQWKHIRQTRGKMGRLIYLKPSQEFITFLRRCGRVPK